MCNLYSNQCTDNKIKDMKCDWLNVNWHACMPMCVINTGKINFASARNIKPTL